MKMKFRLNIILITLLIICNLINILWAQETGMDGVKLMEQGKTDQAIKIFENLSAKGDTKAMVQLGLYYYEVTGVKQDYTKSMDWWLKAYAKKDADAFSNIGVMHRDGQSVPKNQKIAYCIFLTIHMCGLGTESTQQRSNSCLRRIMKDMSKEEVKDCLSNYTLSYIKAYIEAKGELKEIPAEHKPSEKNPALKDTGWFMDSEIDSLYGPPSEEEKKKRAERDTKFKALIHNFVFQLKFPKDSAKDYLSYDFITEDGMSSGPISENKMNEQDGDLVLEVETLISASHQRILTLETKSGEAIVFRINHPEKPSPIDWDKWQKADLILKKGENKLSLLQEESKNKQLTIPENMPQLRFKVMIK